VDHYAAFQHAEPVKVHVEVFVELLTGDGVGNIRAESCFEVVDEYSEYTFQYEEPQYTQNHEQEKTLVVFKVEEFKY
jgi:hypothetical protein